MKQSPETYLIWARLIVKYGLSKKEADEWVGFDDEDTKYPTATHLFFLNEVYREKMREPGTVNFNLATLCAQINAYLGGTATIQDFLPLTTDERDEIENQKAKSIMQKWAALSGEKKNP